MEKLIGLSEAQEAIKTFCRERIENRQYMLDTVDTSAELCEMLEKLTFVEKPVDEDLGKLTPYAAWLEELCR